MTYPPRFGRLLKVLRVSRRLSQSRLAELADLDHAHISRLESGLRHSTPETILRLSQALELGPQDRDHLLIAAGFMPIDFNSLFDEEPVIGETLTFLQDETIPDQVREDVRRTIALVTDSARFAASHSEGAVA